MTDAILAHQLDGTGPVVLLLNGGMMSMPAWDPIARRFAERHAVLRCDFRGQLFSPGAPHPDLAGHVGDVVRLLDHLRIPQAHVVGASFGGEVALLLAASHPDRVSALVAATAADVFDRTPEFTAWAESLVEACRVAADGGDRTRFYDLLCERTYSRAYQAAHAAELQQRRQVIGMLPAWWFANVNAIMASVAAIDLRPHLSAVACPTLVVVAEDDAMVPPPRSYALGVAIPRAIVRTFEGSGHALVIEHQDRFVEVCLRFLADKPQERHT